MGRPTRSAADTAAIEQRRAKVAAYVLHGFSITKIATVMQLDKSTVSRDMTAIRKEWRADRVEDVAEIVEMEMQRLDSLFAPFYKAAIAGEGKSLDHASAKMCLDIIEKRCRLTGADAPVRSQVEMDLKSAPPDMIQRYLASGDPSEIQRHFGVLPVPA